MYDTNIKRTGEMKMNKQQMMEEMEKLGYDNLAPGVGVRTTRNGCDLWLSDATDSQKIREDLKGLGWSVSDNKAAPLTWSE